MIRSIGGDLTLHFELIGDDELIDLLVGLRSNDMLVVNLEELIFFQRVACNRHDSHSSNIVRRVYTKIFWLVVFLNDEVVHSTYCLHEIGQPSSIVGRTLIHKLVVHKGPDPFILVHVGADVKIDKSLPFIGSRQPLVEIRHVFHSIAAMRVNLRTHNRVM